MTALRNKVVWITGASAGIGAELARQAAAQGARVAVSARRTDRLDDLVAELERAHGAEAFAIACDVADEQQIDAAVATVADRFGGMDVAIANAGCSVAGAVEALDFADWRRQLDVNVIGSALTAKHALPLLRERQGRLALVGSVMAMICVPQQAAYAASKHAVRAIGQTLSMELAGSGVSCTTIHPGFVDSDIARVDNAGVFHPDRKDRRPAKLIWPTDRAARVMLRAIVKRKRELVFTGHGKAAGYLGRHMPGFVHFVLTRGSGKQLIKLDD